MKIKATFLYSILCLTAHMGLHAADYYVSTTGKDNNPGTIEKPFRSISKAAENLSPGDTCYIREGRYHQSFSGILKGKSDKPIVFSAYPGEKVVFDGTRDLQLNWQVHDHNIYSATIPFDIWQLFGGDKMMIPARWPNATWEQNWNPKKYWAHGSTKGKDA